MSTVVWVVEGTWSSCVDAALARLHDGEEVVLVHVTPEEIEDSAHAAYAGLLGRGHPDRDPGDSVQRLAEQAADALLSAAQEKVGRACRQVRLSGRVEREVVAAAVDADLLVLARDGDRSRLGPRSLGPATRFVVDHAPCPVLLVWPGETPGVGSIPPPPDHAPGHHPPPPPHP